MLTMYEADEDVHQAMEAGASGYLVKDFPRKCWCALYGASMKEADISPRVAGLGRPHAGFKAERKGAGGADLSVQGQVEQGNCRRATHFRGYSEMPCKRDSLASKRQAIERRLSSRHCSVN